MHTASDSAVRLELEGKVLVAALKQSVDQGDQNAADLAHKQLFQLLRRDRQPKTALEQNVYEILGLSQTASAATIHKQFLRRVRQLIIGKRSQHPMQFLQTLRNLWIAHDILLDPRTRRDYDQRVLRLSSPINWQDANEEHKEDIIAARELEAQKIIQLIELSGLMEQTELSIARDMHKAMPEMQFAHFLVKQRFIEPYQLEAILSAGQLIEAGTITIEQFQESIKKLSDQSPRAVQ